MPIQICNTCGTSYPDTLAPPAGCRICEDERQFVPPGGHAFATPLKVPLLEYLPPAPAKLPRNQPKNAFS